MSTTHSAKELMTFLVAAGGNLPLAAERAGIDKKELVTIVTGGDTSTLSENLRAMLMLQLYDTLVQTNITFQANLPYMSPGDVAKAYASMVQSFTSLTSVATPDLAGEVHDSSVVKEKIITRLDSWKKNGPKQVESTVEDVS